MKDTTENARKIGDELWQWLGGDSCNRRHVACERMFRRMRDMSLGKMNILYNFMLAHFPDVKPSAFVCLQHIYYYMQFDDPGTKGYYERNRANLIRRYRGKTACCCVLSNGIWDFIRWRFLTKKDTLAKAALFLFVVDEGYDMFIKKCNKALMAGHADKDLVERLKTKIINDSLELKIKASPDWANKYEL